MGMCFSARNGILGIYLFFFLRPEMVPMVPGGSATVQKRNEAAYEIELEITERVLGFRSQKVTSWSKKTRGQRHDWFYVG